MSNKRPNVIVFFTDQQRWDTSGLHGNPEGLMPNFDSMATRGTHIVNAVTCQPVCAPARSVLQTGLYPTTNGVFMNTIVLDPKFKRLGGYFQDDGYKTGYIGKWHLSGWNGTSTGHPGTNPDNHGPVPIEHKEGYEYWLASNVLEFTSESYKTTLYDRENNPVDLPGYRVDALTDAAIRFIDERKEDPFFLFVSYIEPHYQNHVDAYGAPDGYRERYTGKWMPPDLQSLKGTAPQHLGGYYGMVKRLDESLGRLQDALKSLDLTEDTVILYTSDHGCHFKTRNSEYKRSPHESSIRIPTAFTGPGFFGGHRIEEPVTTIDMVPTLLDAANIKIPSELEGHSVLPLLKGEKSNWPKEAFIQISESQVGRAIRTNKWKYGVVAPGINGASNPAADMYEETYLYDLESDPYELANLVGFESHRGVADKLKARLLNRIKEVEHSVPEIKNAPVKPSGQHIVYDDNID